METNSEQTTNSNGINNMHGNNPKNGLDFDWIIKRVKTVFLEPKDCWAEIKAEAHSIKDIYSNYLFVLVAIPAVSGFIGRSILGTGISFNGASARVGIVAGIVTAAIQFAAGLAMVYVMARVVEFLVPKFQGNASRVDCFKLVAYCATPNYVAGALSMFPFLGLISLLVGIYSLYLYYNAVSPMTGISEAKRISFVVTSLIVMLVVAFVFGSLIATFSLMMGVLY